jgi:hypothetical protein
MLGDILVDLLVDLLVSVLGVRVSNSIVAMLMVLACVAFAALGALTTYRVLTKPLEPSVGLIALLFFGLSGVSGRLAWKGFRSKVRQRRARLQPASPGAD